MKNLLVAIITTAAAVVSAQSNATFTQCLETALGNDASIYSFQQGAVKPYNLNYATTPAAYTFPKTPQQVSEVVKCAHTAKIAVQARSGGHSYANYGKTASL
jgi:FAD/FMN-containing dehydrogenase